MGAPTVTLYIAASVDGYVADVEGGVDWLAPFEADAAVADGYEAFLASVDALAMGATTYEQVRSFGEWPYGDRPTYVFTHRDLAAAGESVEFVAGAVSEVTERITRDHDHLWLVGGPHLAREFLAAGLVDDLRLSLVPVLLGDGIRLFAGGDARGRAALRLLDTTTSDSGIVELHYRIDD